jgi:hypothetical protein
MISIRTTLRDLPLSTRLVLSVFLCSVGLGYFSALVQLHFKHGSLDGNPLPTPKDVVERFAGVVKHDPKALPPVSKIESLISGTPDVAGWGKANMTPAFFEKSGTSYAKECLERGKQIVDGERFGEIKALKAWIQSESSIRKSAYEADAFIYSLPTDGDLITSDFFDQEKKSLQVKTLIETRCVKCHNGDQKPDLESYSQLEPLITPPSPDILPGGWVRSPKQISIDGLTQSTHAHLLSFSVLFAFTGLIFTLSSYPGYLRAILGPIVLIAQVADISCWWFARLPDWGPYFAHAILLTGSIVGIGLGAQIVLSLLNMYGKRGKTVLMLLLFASFVGFGVLYTKVIEPVLTAEKENFKVVKV